MKALVVIKLPYPCFGRTTDSWPSANTPNDLFPLDRRPYGGREDDVLKLGQIESGDKNGFVQQDINPASPEQMQDPPSVFCRCIVG
jgi:hypothetical protein